MLLIAFQMVSGISFNFFVLEVNGGLYFHAIQLDTEMMNLCKK